MSIVLGHDSSGGTANTHWVRLSPMGHASSPRRTCASAGGPLPQSAAREEVQRLGSPRGRCAALGKVLSHTHPCVKPELCFQAWRRGPPGAGNTQLLDLCEHKDAQFVKIC